MHLRSYNEQTDFIHITKWIQDEVWERCMMEHTK